MSELSRYITSVPTEVSRSELRLAGYNPRKISDEARKMLKKAIKKHGLVGGIVVNRRTGMTLVSGHQRIKVMDELQKYPDNDYKLRVELVDVDEKQEKELNITLNSYNLQGEWDLDALARLLPEIDYQDAGLTEADLSIIGVDYYVQTEEERGTAVELADLAPQKTHEEKTRHMKEVKEQVREQAQEKAQEMEAYVVISFDDWKAKAAFCERFGYDPYQKFIKGEIFNEQI